MIGRLAMVLGILAFMATGTAHAQGNVCAAAKIKAAATKESCLLKFEAAESKKGLTGDPLKLAKCPAKHSSTFAKAEAKAIAAATPCLTTWPRGPWTSTRRRVPICSSICGTRCPRRSWNASAAPP